MNIRLFGFLVPFAALLAAPAYAAETTASCPLDKDGVPVCATPKLELGARVGVGLPLGSAASGTPMNDRVAAQLPLQVDFGFRPDPHVFVGVYGAYGFLFPASGVCDGASCSGSDVKVGLEAHYHFRPTRRFDPWAGLGAGYEWLHTSASRGGEVKDVTLRGFELLKLEGGLDYAPCAGFRVGPFASLSFGKFTDASAAWTVEGTQHAGAVEVTNTALHEWVTLGVRGTFGL